MKLLRLIAVLVLLSLWAPWAPVWAGEAPDDGDEAEAVEYTEESLRAEIGSPQAAALLMARVRAGVPTQPLSMEASIRALSPAGKTLSRLDASVVYRPDTVDPSSRTATYVLLDEARREATAKMDILLPSAPSVAPSFAYEAPPGTSAALPDLYAPVGGTDLCWMELSFSFLFWASPRIVDVEVVRNRWTCQVVELDAPRTLATDAPGAWNRLRLWVAPAYGAVVQGVAYRDDKPLKRFEVESVTHVRRTYMVSDMLVWNLETGTRSRLKISGLELMAPEYTPEQLEQMEAPVVW